MKFIGCFIYFQITTMKCLFVEVDSCRHPIQPLSVGTETRMSSITDASKIRNDGLHLTIEQNCSSAVHYHKNCVSTYTSKCHTKRLSHTIARSNSPLPKRQCRSDLRNFDFNTQCLFCVYVNPIRSILVATLRGWCYVRRLTVHNAKASKQ